MLNILVDDVRASLEVNVAARAVALATLFFFSLQRKLPGDVRRTILALDEVERNTPIQSFCSSIKRRGPGGARRRGHFAGRISFSQISLEQARRS